MLRNFVFLCLGLMTLLSKTALGEIDCNVYPDPANIKVCCSGPEFFTEEITEKCREYDIDMPTDDAHTHHHQHHDPSYHSPCFMSCVFNETGILDEEQKLNEARLHDYLTLVFKDEFKAGIPILEEVFRTCVTKGAEMHSDWLTYKEEKMASDPDFADRMQRQQCSMGPMFLMGCVFIKTYPNCPSKPENKNDQCNTLRNFVRDCEPNIGKWYDSFHRSGPVGNNA